MTYKLFLDDERLPPASWTGTDYVICSNFWAFRDTIKTRGLPEFISFDHDLGSDRTGYDCAKFLCGWMMNNDIHEPIKWATHSMNSVGTRNINEYLSNFNAVNFS